MAVSKLFEFSCDLCAATATSEIDDDVEVDEGTAVDEDEDMLTALPAGWAFIVGHAVQPNPAHAEAHRQWRAVETAARAEGHGDEALSTLRGQFFQQLGNPTPKIVVRSESTVCPNHADVLDEIGLFGGDE